MGKYEILEDPSKIVVRQITSSLKNDLLPSNDFSPERKDRSTTLQKLIEQGTWILLTTEQKDQVFAILTKHHQAFILNTNEHGLIKPPTQKSIFRTQLP